MTTRATSMVRRRRGSLGLTAVLTSAVLEWLLILLLFINGLFSYLVTRLARFCELQIPCLLCSRLDHLFGSETPRFYLDLICSAHKLEISSLVFCSVHNKLADVHGMCEGCLISFSTEKKPDSETYRLLVGALGTERDYCADQNSILKDPAIKKFCSCCNEPWTSTMGSLKMLQFKSTESEVAKLDVPLPDSIEKGHVYLHESLENTEKTSREVASSSELTNTCDPEPPIGYSERKITSDFELEGPYPGDNDKNSLVLGQNDIKGEIISQGVALESQTAHPENLAKTPFDDVATEELNHQGSVSELSPLIPEAQIDVGESRDLKSSELEAIVGYGLADFNSHQIEENADASLPPELVSVQDVPSLFNIEEVVEESAETANVTGTDMHESASDEGIQEISKLENGLISSSEPDMKPGQIFNDSGPSMTNLMDLNDAYNLVVNTKRNQMSSMPEPLTVRDSTKVSGDLKRWLSQISSSRGFELSLGEISPGVYGNWEDLKTSDGSSPIGLQIHQKRISLERNMSGFESLEESIVNEVEGESVVDRLKRQVEHDRKSMSALYKELEEERNASAVSANQTLAMITRLQEEKATLQTEALQYLRMMEEQAEYDVDALEKANILLAEKEKEVQVLEAELEIYREKFPCESMEKKQEVMRDSEGGNTKINRLDVNCIGYNINTPCNTPRPHFDKTYMVTDNDSTMITDDLLVGFEDERLYISQCLKKLENKLHLFSNYGVHFSDGEYFGKEDNGVNKLRPLYCEDVTQGSNHSEEDGLSMQKTPCVCSATENCSSSVDDFQFVTRESYSSNFEGRYQDSNLGALEHEISSLNERLTTLEADRYFLEHTINSLRAGDGVQFIQEIAHDLRELRRIGIRREQVLQ